jgi:hypothetical protein
MNRRKITLGSGAALVLVGATLVLASQVSVSGAAPVRQAQPTPTPLTLQQLSAIQPGLGTIMIEYGHRFAAMWFAGQAGNWDFAQYQLIEMREIQEVGETTRPARAPALKSFESQFLDPLEDQIKAKDKAKFETAYNSAVQGCNSCHGSQTSGDWPQGFRFIKVQVPKDTLESVYAYTP